MGAGDLVKKLWQWSREQWDSGWIGTAMKNREKRSDSRHTWLIKCAGEGVNSENDMETLRFLG